MAEMTKERWTKIALEMEPHLKAIHTIVRQAGLDLVSAAVYGGGTAWANYIDDKGIHHGIDIRDEITALSVDWDKYYTKN